MRRRNPLIVVRHNASHAVVASAERLPDGGLKLRGVGPLDGQMPDVTHLIGQRFPDLPALRRALVAAMRGTVGDTLDHVLLSRWAYQTWVNQVSKAAKSLKGVAKETIPNGMVKPLPDGSLFIWADFRSEKAKLTVPREHWVWLRRPTDQSRRAT